jgi:hypothetical protein
MRYRHRCHEGSQDQVLQQKEGQIVGSLKRLSFGLVLVFCPAFTSGQDKLEPDKVQKVKGLTGIYRGWFYYPDDNMKPVCFQMLLVQNGSTVAGFIKEPNTFGTRREPFLAAAFKGKYDPETGKLTFTKFYDGTAGPDHEVEYSAEFGKDGKKAEGTWAIGGAGARFTLDKIKGSGFGPYSGIWSGTYEYPADADRKPVDFQAVIVHHGKRIFGFMKERDTFAKSEEPWLHANLRGHVDDKTGKMVFMKTYDGTAGQDHDVEYTGEPSRDKKQVVGTWTIPDVFTGRFTIQRKVLNAKTLESLK